MAKGLAQELRDLEAQVKDLTNENLLLTKKPDLVSEYGYKKRIKKLENKVKTLEKSDREWRRRYTKYHDVHSYIMDCYSRMKQSKYSFDDNRVREIIHVLKRLLP